MPVAHGANVETEFALNVALFKELLHDSISPLTIQVERLHRVAEISTVNHILKHL